VRLAEDGAILAQCGCVTPGYFKNPELTAAILDEQGWLHIGDVGTLDEDGYLRIIDRNKELITPLPERGGNRAPVAFHR
jgi:long-chain acyl-CoA synthetase